MLRRRPDRGGKSDTEGRGALADALARLEETLRGAERELQAVRLRARIAPPRVPRVPRPSAPRSARPDVPEEPPAAAPPPPEASAPATVDDPLDSAPDVAVPAQADSPREPTPSFGRQVEIDVGPFGDFAALSAFERAVAGLPGVESVFVRRFLNDRAIVEVSAVAELPLVDALRDGLPFDFDLDRAEGDWLRITLAEPGRHSEPETSP
jgi:hypothetical protein